MTCREAQRQISADRDGARDDRSRAAWAEHIGQCAACREFQATLTRTIDAWRAADRVIATPDAELEWQELRRTIRGGATRAAPAATPGRRLRLGWLALPIAAALAAGAFFLNPSTEDPALPHPAAPRVIATATAAPAAAESTSTVVFVDDKSGYVFVYADDSGHI